MSKSGPVRVSPEDFVRWWQRAGSVAEFCEKTGMAPGSAKVRASWYRRKGIPLKKMSTNNRVLDLKALARIAKESL